MIPDDAIWFTTAPGRVTGASVHLDNLAADRGLARWLGESDEDLRERLGFTLRANQAGSRDQLVAAVEAIPGVRRCRITTGFDERNVAFLDVEIDVTSELSLEDCEIVHERVRRTIGANIPTGVEFRLEFRLEQRHHEPRMIGEEREPWGFR
jgi:hypothetical protein